MMQTTEKISGTQLGFLLFSFVFPPLVISVPGMMAVSAKQNAWISVFPALITGLITIWVMTSLANRYPGLTIIEYSSKIIGKWPGKFVGLLFTYYLFSLNSIVVNEHSRFVHTFILPKTPPLVGSLTLMILCGLAVFVGLEVIGRSNEFLAPFIIFFLIPLFILALGDSDTGQLKPFLGEGIMPVLKGAFVLSSHISQIFILGWFLPFLNQPGKGHRCALTALLGIVLLILIVDLLTIMIFGPITGKLNYSFLGVIQFIGILGSLERLEAIAVCIWVAGIFVKVSILLFILCLSISQLFEIRNYRDIIAPVSLLTIIGSVWVFNSRAEYLNYFTVTYPFWSCITQILLPLALLLIDTMKRKRNKSLF